MAKIFGNAKDYAFLDKDPEIDRFRTVFQDSGKTITQLIKDTNYQVTHKTISNWLYGETKNPQRRKFDVALKACGYQLNIVPIDTPHVIVPTTYTPEAYRPESRAVSNIKYFRKANVKRKVK